MQAQPAPQILVLVRDLMFASKVRSAARSVEAGIHLLREPRQLADTDTLPPARRLIVDLNQPAALEAAVQWKHRTGGEVVGFVSHVDSETIQSARSAGVDQVLPRSRFVERLAELLR